MSELSGERATPAAKRRRANVIEWGDRRSSSDFELGRRVLPESACDTGRYAVSLRVCTVSEVGCSCCTRVRDV